MSKNELPNALKKRDLLYSKVLTADQKTAWGRKFLETGYVMDALAFFLEASAEEELIKLRDKAIEEGDAFMLKQIQLAVPPLVTEANWDGLATHAGYKGKEAFQEQAEAGGEVKMPVVDAVIQEDPTHHEGEEGEEEAGEEVREDSQPS